MNANNQSAPVQAITKEQVAQNLADRVFPDFVIQAFNECIQESKQKHSNNVYRKDVVARIIKLGDTTDSVIMANNWLDIESFYRKAGWKVSYYKPDFNESGDSYFTFT